MGVCMDSFIDCILVYYNEDAMLQVTPSFFGASLLEYTSPGAIWARRECRAHHEPRGIPRALLWAGGT
jgi:hypothetical protein